MYPHDMSAEQNDSSAVYNLMSVIWPVNGKVDWFLRRVKKELGKCG